MIKFFDKQFRPNTDIFNWESNGKMVELFGITLERAQELSFYVDQIATNNPGITNKILFKQSLETLPNNQQEFNFLIFNMGAKCSVNEQQAQPIKILITPPGMKPTVIKKDDTFTEEELQVIKNNMEKKEKIIN